MDRYRTIATRIAERCTTAGYGVEGGDEMWVTEITKALATEAVRDLSVPEKVLATRLVPTPLPPSAPPEPR